MYLYDADSTRPTQRSFCISTYTNSMMQIAHVPHRDNVHSLESNTPDVYVIIIKYKLLCVKALRAEVFTDVSPCTY